MTIAVPEGLPALWYEYWRRSSGTRDERKALELGQPAEVVAAVHWVADRVDEGGREAVVVLSMLAQAAPEGDHGLIVGVGPLEELLYTHGDGIVEAVVEEARHSPAFARALGHVALADGSLSPSSLAAFARYQAGAS